VTITSIIEVYSHSSALPYYVLNVFFCDRTANCHNETENVLLCLCETECTKCRGATYEAKPCGGISDRHCIRKYIAGTERTVLPGSHDQQLRRTPIYARSLGLVIIGVNAAGDAGDAFPAIFGQPETKCLISPPKFVKIVIKLPAELMRTVQPAFAVQARHQHCPRECDSFYFA